MTNSPTVLQQVDVIRLASGTVVAVYGTETPDDAEWARYMVVLRQLRDRDRMVIFSAGGGPNLMQRRDIEEVTSKLQGSVAVITTSRVARGIVTAIRWFNKDIKAFEPARRDEAFEFLAMKPSEMTEVLVEARRMATKLGVGAAIGL